MASRSQAILVAASMLACAGCGVLVDFDGYRRADEAPADEAPADEAPSGPEPAGPEVPAGRESATPSNTGKGLDAPAAAGGPGATPPSPEPPAVAVTVFQSYWFQRGAASFPVSDAEGLAQPPAVESRTLVPGSFPTARGGGLELDAAGSFVYRPPGTAGAFWGDDYIEYAFAGEPAVRGRARLTVQPRLVDLDELAASSGAGWGVAGALPQDQVGSTVAGQLPVRRRPFAPAGDVNGDGLEDFVIGVLGPAQQYDNGVPYGEGRGAYVLFGKKGASNSSLAGPSGSVPPAGFAILDNLADGAADSLGFSVAGAGDVDGDGLDDIIVGSHSASLDCPLDDPGCVPAGAAYVIFGKQDSEAVDLERLRAGLGGGFAILPPNGVVSPQEGPSYFFAGFSVDKAGDVNGDGLGDVIVGVPFFTPGADSVFATPAPVSAAHVVFGKRGDEPVGLENVANGQGGFPILATAEDLGFQVAGVGDVNGDGLDDVAMSSEFYPNAGRVAVVLGKQDTLPVLLADIEAGSREGFLIVGAGDGDYTGTPVYAGDVNGDGFDDVVIASPYVTRATGETALVPDATSVDAGVDAGAVVDAGVEVDAASGPADCLSPPCPDTEGQAVGGRVYILFGTREFRDIQLGWWDGDAVPEGYFPKFSDIGLLFWGTDLSDHVGYSVSSGDIDGDGLSDVIVTRDPTTRGDAIVLFGKQASADASPPILFVASSSTERVCASAVSGADTNGDGFDDLLVSSESYADAPEGAGGAYVVLGWDFTQAQAGRDVALLGGPGDDQLSLPATPIVVVKGGHGNDTLKVGSSTRTLDLTQHGRYRSVEVVDVRGGGPQDVLLNDAAVRRLPETRGDNSFGLARRLIVRGDAEDHLHFDATGYSELGTTPGGRVYGRTGAHYGLEVSTELLPFSAP